MKRLLYIIAAASLLCGCEKHEDVLFDTPFATITDVSKQVTSMTISKDANNLLSELCISIDVSADKFTEPITVEYEMTVGDGLTEGVDFRVQASTKSPVTFQPGTYEMPVRLIWLKNSDFDSTKDNTLTIRLTGSSLKDMTFGYPGPAGNRSIFTFTKQ